MKITHVVPGLTEVEVLYVSVPEELSKKQSDRKEDLLRDQVWAVSEGQGPPKTGRVKF